jgi:hypothetical protein
MRDLPGVVHRAVYRNKGAGAVDIKQPTLSVLWGHGDPICGARERVFGDNAQIAFCPLMT